MEIPGYQIGREVNSGTYSSVYNALDIGTSITVSVRVFNHTLRANENFCAQFRKAVFPLIDQKIGIMVPVRQAIANEQHCYLITDYFHGSQQQFESTITFSPRQLLQFGQQLASTLELIHGMNLVHGGIQSSNVLFTDQSQIVLGFLSLHKTLPSISHIANPTNSLEMAMYQAPEIQQGLTAATDFYALGILLYQLLEKKNPFDARDLAQLELQKNHLELNFPHGEHKNLEPLFKQVLHPDPEQRITTAQQYQQAVEACGYSVKLPGYSFHPKPDPLQHQPAMAAAGPKTGIMKNKWLLASTFVLVCVAVVVFFLLPEKKQLPPSGPTPSGVIIDSKAVSPANINKTNNTGNNGQALEIRQAESLYQEALQSAQKKNYGSALMNANNALKENPKHELAQRLKLQIERELEAQALISRAEKQLSQNKLTRPEGDNAFESYQQLSKMLPPDDRRAQQGLEKISGYYSDLAKTEISRNNFDKARSYIASGNSVIPGYGPLKEVELALQQQQSAQQRRQEKIRAAKALKERQLKQQQLLEQNKQRERDQQLLAEKQQQRIQQQKITTLIAEAQKNLELKKLSLSSISRAKSRYKELKGLEQNDERISELKQEILDAYGILAISQKNANQYNSALITVRQGLLMDKKNQNLSLIRNEINALIALTNKPAEKKPQIATERNDQLPVIGTF